MLPQLLLAAPLTELYQESGTHETDELCTSSTTAEVRTMVQLAERNQWADVIQKLEEKHATDCRKLPGQETTPADRECRQGATRQ